MEHLIYTEIGRKIREERDKKGWTQQELSDMVELTRSSIANIELGRQKIQVHVLYTFAKLFGINPTDLMPQTNQIYQDEVITDEKESLDKESRDFLERILKKSSHGGGDEK
ncbi:helix-turn-helix domain-containing protein [Cohnella cholangitidis]|uniref:Helix-turn-helix transcriptional regulator n=1 Tax=Cohnella cholangitidis TaxID=2598458 RepID=A0A7G5C0D1_9BACL|nr:helix-turn-helix transcriptional regulator [Cohnella cholangitidis]QMV42665.1 helix-turn-helix transcriptional regulator [Cohnella cholangitidis]